MNYKYRRCLLLIFAISICFSLYSKAQAELKDTVPNKQYVIKNIAYGAQPAWMVTSAISTVYGSELQHSFGTNLDNTLNGRLSGLTVRQGSGEPGADSPVLNGRGLNTYGPGTAVLIMVDGFENTMEQLVPEEIESVVLLKDASATAMYGSRGANGVLLVTTKRGKEGPLKVNFSTQQGFQSAQRLPEFLGSYDYARLYNEALVNDGKSAQYTASDLNAYKAGNDPYFHPNVNWYHEVLRKSAPIANYNMNFSGGDKYVKYYVLLNAIKSNGLYERTERLSENSKDEKYSRYNFRTNVDIQVTKRLTANFTLGGTVEDNAVAGGNNTSAMFDLMSSIPANAFPVYNPNNTFGGNGLYKNPVGNILQSGFSTSNGRSLQATLKLTEQLDAITKGLSVSAAFSFNNYFKGYSNKSKQYLRFALSKNAAGDTIYSPFGQKSSLSDDESQSNQWHNIVFQSFLNYDRTFGNNTINAVVMYNMDSYVISGNDLPFKHTGLGGRFTLTNSRKYIAELSMGYNGSENFAKGRRFGFFPSVSAGWIASNEEFLKGNSVINFLKVRASYGMVGNDKIGGKRFGFSQYYDNSGGSFLYGPGTWNSGMAEGILANPFLTWERERKMNFGAEVTLWNRLDVTVDLFKNDRSDILSVPNGTIPQYLGANLPDLNVGKTTNQGFEAGLRFNSKQGTGIQYFVEPNLWYAKNKIVYNSEPTLLSTNSYLYRTGRSINQPFLLQAIGFFKDQADINASPKQIFTTVQPGDVKYKDQNGDGIIDQNDYTPSGKSILPELTLGLHTGMSYKKFDLDIMFQGVTDCSVYLGGYNYQAFQNNGSITTIALNRWTPATAATATYPRLSAENNLNNFQPSTLWQRDGSFIKLRSLEIGYTLDGNLVKKAGISKSRVFINGTNLFSIDHMKGSTDPETLSGYPATRVLSAGIKIQF